MNTITPKIALLIHLVGLVFSLILYFFFKVTESMLLGILCLVICILSLAVRIVFYRCPQCRRYLGRGRCEFCRHCGSPTDY